MKTDIVVFGATGNLMYKKLLPAFASLVKKGHLNTDSRIVCVGRRPLSTEQYLELARSEVKVNVDWRLLSPFIQYFSMDLNQRKGYEMLAKNLKQNRAKKRIFYLAIAPELFGDVAQELNASNLVVKGNSLHKVGFEKPFGEDLASAKAINAMLWQYFEEKQIFRVDHYLGKEMIQNIMVMRFANRLFEQGWHHQAIEKVTIIAKESEGVMNRGGYYDSVGALKDMVQSHLLQMAALIAMEPPTSFDVEGIRDQKVEVIKKLRFDEKVILFGQYDGYKKEKNIDPKSITDTFVCLKATFDTTRWTGVPFYFITGKKLNTKVTEIIIDFKKGHHQDALYPDQALLSNRLIINVTPDEGVEFRMNIKRPGLSNKIRPVDMNRCYDCDLGGNSPEAYERIIVDLLEGNSTLFARWDEIESAWKLIDDVQKYRQIPYIYHSTDELKSTISLMDKEAVSYL